MLVSFYFFSYKHHLQIFLRPTHEGNEGGWTVCRIKDKKWEVHEGISPKCNFGILRDEMQRRMGKRKMCFWHRRQGSGDGKIPLVAASMKGWRKKMFCPLQNSWIYRNQTAKLHFSIFFTFHPFGGKYGGHIKRNFPITSCEWDNFVCCFFIFLYSFRNRISWVFFNIFSFQSLLLLFLLWRTTDAAIFASSSSSSKSIFSLPLARGLGDVLQQECRWDGTFSFGKLTSLV